MTTAFPLKASANGHYLVDQNNVPFLMIGDSAQTLINHLSLTDVASYMDQRISQGFNTVLIELLSQQNSTINVPKAFNGALPFTTAAGGGSYTGLSGTADFSTPNASYFSWVDSVFALAAARNLLLIVYPLPWGFGGDGTQGWWPDLENSTNTSAVCNAFGQFLGNRYKNQANIIWLDGSDYFGTTTPNAPDSTSGIQRAAQIAAGMQTAGAIQLRSGDWASPSASTDGPADRPTSFVPITQVNGAYTYGGVFNGTTFIENPVSHTYSESRLTYTFVPTVATQGNPGAVVAPPAEPPFLKETSYDGSPFSDGSTGAVRRCEYWSIFSGCIAGLLYGSESIWPFVNGTWQTAMTQTSAADITRMAAFLQSFAWYRMVPSELGGMRRLIPSSNGTQVGEPDNYIAAYQDSSGAYFAAYAPVFGSGAQTFTVDTRSMSVSSFRARWWDPTSGNFTAIGNFSNTLSAQSFTTPGNNSAGQNDWILFFDAPVMTIPLIGGHCITL